MHSGPSIYRVWNKVQYSPGSLIMISMKLINIQWSIYPFLNIYKSVFRSFCLGFQFEHNPGFDFTPNLCVTFWLEIFSVYVTDQWYWSGDVHGLANIEIRSYLKSFYSGVYDQRSLHALPGNKTKNWACTNVYYFISFKLFFTQLCYV